MTNQQTLVSLIDGVADAIRAKTGGSAEMTLAQMDDAVESIPVFDWSQLNRLPNFANTLTSAQPNFDASGIRTSNARSMFQPPSGVTCQLKNFVAGTMDTSECTSFYYAFCDSKLLETCDLHTLDLSAQSVDTTYMFAGCTALTSVNITGLDMSHVSTFQSMFEGCTALPSFSFAGKDLSGVTRTDSMFKNCSSLTSVDFSGADLSGNTKTNYMFANCSSLTSVDFSGADLSGLQDVSYMFQNCSALTSIDLSDANIRETIGYMSNWFEGAGITSFDSSGISFVSNLNANNCQTVFSGCRNLASLDASAWGTNIAGKSFCKNCSSLESAYFPHQNEFRGDMFNGCSSLVCLIWALDLNTSSAASSNSNQLTGSAIANGTGYVYVRDSKVESYKASGFLSNYASQVKPISECPQQYLNLYNIDPADYQ